MVKLLSWVKRWFFGEPDSSSVVSCPGTEEDQREPETMTPALPKGGLFKVEEDPEEDQIGEPAAASSDKNDHLIEALEEPEPEPGSLEAWKREQLRKLRGR